MSEEEQRICQGVSDKLLDSQVSDYHIAEIANDLVEWEDLSPFLDLTDSEQKEILEDFQGRYNLQKRQALRVWRWKNGDKATYRALISICCSQGLVQLAETIVSYIGADQRPRSSQILDTFHRYLLDCYVDSPHPSRKQWPGNKLPMRSSTTFLDLNLLEAPLHECNSPGNNFKEVTLKSVLSKKDEQKRVIVYFEGIAGSGKTTLSWYACREWAKKKLLGDFQLLIHLQLTDPQVQSATCLPDIIPYPDKKLRQEIASTIVDCKGRGVCFLLDGLDEAPTNLLDFLLGNLIQGKLGSWQLPELSFVLTSRPDASVTALLESIIDIKSRILMSGFSRENLEELLVDRLGATSKERGKLVEEFKINPRLKGLCSHPINAVIMTFLVHFLEKGTPTTQTDLFKPLVCNFLIRHMSTRFDKSCKIDSLVNDESIPREIRKSFRSMCSLAYTALCENKRLFTKEEADFDTLGFLHVHSTVTMFGSERYYSFDHLSIQEFLAAIHLARMKNHQQSNAVKLFLDKSPRSQILPFYAGLTGLSNKYALKLLSKSLGSARDCQPIIIVEKLRSSQGRSDPQQEALTFLKCLFECKNESVWKLPETELHINTMIPNDIECPKEASCGYEISSPRSLHSLLLWSLALTPLDCLSLGYYINAKSFMPKSQTLRFCLDGCSIDIIGIRLLFTELKKDINYHTDVRVQLILLHNMFNEESVLYLKELLRGQSNLEGISLCGCFDPSVVDLNFVFKSLIEGLSDNSSCKYIDLSCNHFSSSHIYYFILMLRYCPPLTKLTLTSYDLSRVMPLFSSALLFTTTLYSLNVSLCNISDSELVQLGTEVSICRSLEQLYIGGNPFTDDGLTNFLKLFMITRSKLRFLEIEIPPFFARQPNQSALNILEKMNQFRSRIGYAHLIINSYKGGMNFSASLNNDYLIQQENQSLPLTIRVLETLARLVQHYHCFNESDLANAID